MHIHASVGIQNRASPIALWLLARLTIREREYFEFGIGFADI